jgi:hypothetical protein
VGDLARAPPDSAAKKKRFVDFADRAIQNRQRGPATDSRPMPRRAEETAMKRLLMPLTMACS